jgi:hypothetical protein
MPVPRHPGNPVASRLAPAVVLLLAVAVWLPAGVAAADAGVEQQLERAQVLRELRQWAPAGDAGNAAGPDRVEAAARADLRWRSLLQSQQTERLRQDALPGGAVRALGAERQQRADALADRIHQHGRESMRPIAPIPIK